MHRFLSGLLVALGLLLALPVQSQDTGLIVEGNRRGEAGLGALNPLRCFSENCARINDMLYPRLLRIDPTTRYFAPATADDGLAESWTFGDRDVTFTLRTDRFWRDGVPVTADDVYFTYLAIAADDVSTPFENLTDLIVSAEVIDPATIRFNLTEHDCTALDLLNIPVVPAHVFEPDFAAVADIPDAAELDFTALSDHPANREPDVTAGDFVFYERRYQDYIRLIDPETERAFSYVDVVDRDVAVDRFIRGELNLIIDPPYDRRRDLAAVANVQMIEQPGDIWYFVMLNQADPGEPASAFDADDGTPLEQGHHPVFGDVRVRRAMQLAVNVEAMSAAAAEGYGVPLASGQPPASWAFNSELAPPPYDPAAAAALLFEAGWRDINRDGIRECFDCLYARPGTNLVFELLYVDVPLEIGGQPPLEFGALANLMQQQLRQIGFDVLTTPIEPRFGFLTGQRFDAVLVASVEPRPVDPGYLHSLFATQNDIVEADTIINPTSYSNPEVDALLEAARTEPTCDVDTRRALYAETQAVLQADQPYIWLFSPTRLLVAQGAATEYAAERVNERGLP